MKVMCAKRGPRSSRTSEQIPLKWASGHRERQRVLSGGDRDQQQSFATPERRWPPESSCGKRGEAVRQSTSSAFSNSVLIETIEACAARAVRHFPRRSCAETGRLPVARQPMLRRSWTDDSKSSGFTNPHLGRLESAVDQPSVVVLPPPDSPSRTTSRRGRRKIYAPKNANTCYFKSNVPKT